MKKFLCVIMSLVIIGLCSVPAFAVSCESSFGSYKHVYIIGVDGAGRFFKDADTPNFDRIFKNGAVDYYARAEIQTISAQNWGSILTGVSYTKHKLCNEVTYLYERSSDTEFPTIFTYARQAFPDAELASFVNWNDINFGIIENDVGVKKTSIGNDIALADAICSYFDEGNDPALFFVQFDSVDGAGHAYGSKDERYFTQIGVVDGLIGRVY
ncbi:MAG: alkaline phosphatase family protein, partial [Clostridia bacterium]|nr:alkaline phosphatase family protein [Clostridia bacterium]